MNVLFEPVEIFQSEDYEMSIEFESTVSDVFIRYQNADGILKEISGVDEENNEYSFLLESADTDAARVDVYDLIVHYTESGKKQYVKVSNYLKIVEL